VATITVVAGAQFGSEGKGAVCGWLGERQTDESDLAVRVAGPNAGHTVYDKAGNVFKLRALPVAAVTSDLCQLHIAAGSEIDPEVLLSEINQVTEAGHRIDGRLSIHPSATILTQRHKEAENLLGLVNTIGSTGKGIGGARADRIMRRADLISAMPTFKPYMSEPGTLDLRDAGRVVIEGTQGYGLGLHTQFYPQVTSSDCRAIDFLSMAGISPWADYISELRIILVARVYPIRVAGNSGPLKGETTWQELGLPQEHTTVTNKVRRVGEPDWELVAEAVEANGGGDWHPGVDLAVTMIDQMFPAASGKTDQVELDNEVVKYLAEVEEITECNVHLVGTGPKTLVEL
jgi:adenylosuccinate synthase